MHLYFGVHEFSENAKLTYHPTFKNLDFISSIFFFFYNRSNSKNKKVLLFIDNCFFILNSDTYFTSNVFTRNTKFFFKNFKYNLCTLNSPYKNAIIK